VKKKILSGILGFILLLCLTGCGNNKYNNVIVDGNEISLNDIIEEFKSNSAAAEERYSTKSISYTGKIEEIESVSSINLGGCTKVTGYSSEKYYKIKFLNDNINILLYLNDSEINISDYKIGDVVTVKTNISELYDYEETTYSSIYFLALANYSGNSCDWGDTPTIITINK